MRCTAKQRKAAQALFVAYLNQECQSLKRERRFGLACRTESVRNSFLDFLRSRGREDIRVCDLSASVVLDYQQWLIDRGVQKNSSSCYIRTLQSIYNKHIAGLPGLPEKPFSKVYRGIAKTRKRAAGIALIQEICSLDIAQGLIALGKSPERKTFAMHLHRVTFARDLFVFCYCARGLSFVDAAYLKKTSLGNGIIRYQRCKTGQIIEVAVEPIMQDIIDRYAPQAQGTPYLFPILPLTDAENTYIAYRSALRSHNGYLKMVARMLGADVSLTSYVARHSWASHMHDMNVPMAVISQGLGHGSELTTQIYIKSLESNVLYEANRDLISRLLPVSPHGTDLLFNSSEKTLPSLCPEAG